MVASPLRRGMSICASSSALGLLRYLGGALNYADYLGLKSVVECAIYRASKHLRAIATTGHVFLSALSTSTVCEVQC